MTQVNLGNLPVLLDIANKAIELREAEKAAELEKDDLRLAYRNVARRLGIQGYADRNSKAWEAMMRGTKGEYEASQLAKRKAYNAKRKLQRAVDRFQIGGAA